MAVPFINIFANTMGGIGTIELNDRQKLSKLTAKNNIPFYAGRFYPKNTAEEWNLLQPGLIAETPPWMTWKDIGNTQIWMVPSFQDERIISTTTEIVRIDVWPRDDEEEEDLGEIPDTFYDRQRQSAGWRDLTSAQNSLDPGVQIVQNVTASQVLSAGYLGISLIKGYVSEYAFYDQELILVNGLKYGQAQYKGKARAYSGENYYGREKDYYEIWKIRGDGLWVKENAKINTVGRLEYPNNPSTGYPIGFSQIVPAANYSDWVCTDRFIAGTYGNDKLDFYTKIDAAGIYEVPTAGIVQAYTPSRLDTVVYTIKTSVVSIITPDLIPGDDYANLEELSKSAIESFGTNLFNNIWYFYMPVRYNGIYQGDRIEHLFARGAINRLQSGLLNVD